MSTVWVVIDEFWNDKIKAVFDTEKAAHEYSDKHDLTIKTWELNKPDGQQTYEYWQVSVTTGIRGPNDGTAWTYWDISEPRRRVRDVTEERSQVGLREYGNSIDAWADTKERALKIAQDEVARRKATEAGLT